MLCKKCVKVLSCYKNQWIVDLLHTISAVSLKHCTFHMTGVPNNIYCFRVKVYFLLKRGEFFWVGFRPPRVRRYNKKKCGCSLFSILCFLFSVFCSSFSVLRSPSLLKILCTQNLRSDSYQILYTVLLGWQVVHATLGFSIFLSTFSPIHNCVCTWMLICAVFIS